MTTVYFVVLGVQGIESKQAAFLNSDFQTDIYEELFVEEASG